MQYYVSIQDLTDIGIWTMFIAEFEYNILVILFVALIVNYCYTQKELLFGGNFNENIRNYKRLEADTENLSKRVDELRKIKEVYDTWKAQEDSVDWLP